MYNKNIKIFLAFSLIFLVSGCGLSQDKKIKIDGSATVMPITQTLIEDFSKENRDVEITLSSSGTGGGFSKFINNEIDIQNASRNIKEKEKEKAVINNINYTELVIAKDAIVVAVNKNNNFLKNLNKKQLFELFSKSSNIKTWSDIDSNFPNDKIDFFIPPVTSGTHEYFKDKVSGNKTELREDVTSTQDLNLLLKGIEENKNSIGFFSYSYYLNGKDKIRTISIDSIQPDIENIKNNTYKLLTRNLYFYINNQKYEEKESLRDLLNYYFKNYEYIAREQGFIELSGDEYEKQIALIKDINKP